MFDHHERFKSLTAQTAQATRNTCGSGPLGQFGLLLVGTLGRPGVWEEQMLFAGSIAHLISDSVLAPRFHGAAVSRIIVLVRSVCILVISNFVCQCLEAFSLIIRQLT